MTYKISFNAVTISDGYVGTRHFTIDTTHPLDIHKMSFGRMCVEYARLTGLKCSYVQILEVKEVNQ